MLSTLVTTPKSPINEIVEIGITVACSCRTEGYLQMHFYVNLSFGVYAFRYKVCECV